MTLEKNLPPEAMGLGFGDFEVIFSLNSLNSAKLFLEIYRHNYMCYVLYMHTYIYMCR